MNEQHDKARATLIGGETSKDLLVSLEELVGWVAHTRPLRDRCPRADRPQPTTPILVAATQGLNGPTAPRNRVRRYQPLFRKPNPVESIMAEPTPKQAS